MATLPLTLSVETVIGLRGVLPFKGTFPIGNLIPGLRLGFFKDTIFQKLWSHFLGFYFLFYFPFKNKNEISGDSNFFSKINFSQIKSESRRSSGGAREKCGSTPTLINYFIKEYELKKGPLGLIGQYWLP